MSKWPFFLGDALLLGLAWFVFFQSKSPMGRWEIPAYVFCVAVGAGLGVLPFLLEYRAVMKLMEADGLASVVSQIEHLEQLAAQIGYATSQWQIVRESADKTANTAKQIADGMAAEVQAFNEFMQRATEGEKATLRLEVDKLRRAEADWLQVLVRMLDHVYALHRAALHSHQPELIEQLGHFQNACRDAARRVGLMPFSAAPAEPFDAQRHQIVDGGPKPAAAAAVEETIATGYTFQGRLLRPVLVRLQKAKPTDGQLAEAPDGTTAGGTGAEQSRLPLEPAKAG